MAPEEPAVKGALRHILHGCRRYSAGPLGHRYRPRRRPRGPAGDVEGEDRARRRAFAILRVLVDQRSDRLLDLSVGGDDATVAVEPHPPQARPVLVVGVDEQAGGPGRFDVRRTAQPRAALGLVVDRAVHDVVAPGEADRHDVRQALRADRGAATHPRGVYGGPHRGRIHGRTICPATGPLVLSGQTQRPGAYRAATERAYSGHDTRPFQPATSEWRRVPPLGRAGRGRLQPVRLSLLRRAGQPTSDSARTPPIPPLASACDWYAESPSRATGSSCAPSPSTTSPPRSTGSVSRSAMAEACTTAPTASRFSTWPSTGSVPMACT